MKRLNSYSIDLVFLLLIPQGFELWNRGLVFDKKSLLKDSRLEFQTAAKAFFDGASSDKAGIARALLEYSTLMDAYSMVQEGRLHKSELRFDEALTSFAKASEIFRATVHFGFMAGYVSGCASLETAGDMEDDEEKFRGYKNSIVLLEQSKLALGFRDDRHPLVQSIDGLVKFAVSRALLVESAMLVAKGSLSDSAKKREQSKDVEEDFRKLSHIENNSPISRFKIDYFLRGYDCERAKSGSFITSFPEKTSLWIGNVGKNPALIEALGKSVVEKILLPYDSMSWPMVPEFRGKLRITYVDQQDNRQYDEGCLTVI